MNESKLTAILIKPDQLFNLQIFNVIDQLTKEDENVKNEQVPDDDQSINEQIEDSSYKSSKIYSIKHYIDSGLLIENKLMKNEQQVSNDNQPNDLSHQSDLNNHQNGLNHHQNGLKSHQNDLNNQPNDLNHQNDLTNQPNNLNLQNDLKNQPVLSKKSSKISSIRDYIDSNLIIDNKPKQDDYLPINNLLNKLDFEFNQTHFEAKNESIYSNDRSTNSEVENESIYSNDRSTNSNVKNESIIHSNDESNVYSRDFEFISFADLNKNKINSRFGKKFCNLCNLECSSEKDYQGHCSGRKHKMKQAMADKNDSYIRLPNENKILIIPDKVDYLIRIDQEERQKNKVAKYCATCKINCIGVNSINQHWTGKKHLSKLNNVSISTNLNEKFKNYCNLCNVFCSGRIHLNAHINGKSHYRVYKRLIDSGKVVDVKFVPKFEKTTISTYRKRQSRSTERTKSLKRKRSLSPDENIEKNLFLIQTMNSIVEEHQNDSL